MTNPVILTIAKALGWTLVHSLWQIAIVALVLKGLLSLSSNRSARLRYGFTIGAMSVILVWSMLTFWLSYEPIITIVEGNLLSDESIALPLLSNDNIEVSIQTSTWELWVQQIEQYLPYLTVLWVVGLLLFSFSTMRGYFQLNQLLYNAVDADALWQAKLTTLKQQLGVTKNVRLAITEQLEEPITFRHFKPVILLPMSLLSGLTVDQVEVLILHELAHIRRHDYLINWIQSALEALFFYHPAFWWIARQVRAEREHCCDDLVLQLHQQPMLYAQTLTQLQFNHHSLTTNLAMSATKNQGVFTTRIHRLFGKYYAPNRQRKGAIITALVALFFIGVAFYQPNPLEIENFKAATVTQDTLPPKTNLTKPEAVAELQQLLGKVLKDEEQMDVKYHVDAVLDANGNWVYDTTILVDICTDKEKLPTTITEEEKQAIFDVAFEHLTDDVEEIIEAPVEEFKLVRNEEGGIDTIITLESFKVDIQPDKPSATTLTVTEQKYDKQNKAVEYDSIFILDPVTFEERLEVIERKKGEVQATTIQGRSAGVNIADPKTSNVNPSVRLGNVSDEKEQPLFVLNGIIIGKPLAQAGLTKLEDIDPNTIESITVLKGEAAIEKYSEDGRHGVVEVYTKNWKRKQKRSRAKNIKPDLKVFVDAEKELVQFVIDMPSNSSSTWQVFDPTGKKIEIPYDKLLEQGNTKEGAMSWKWATKNRPAGTYKTTLEVSRTKEIVERTFQVGNTIKPVAYAVNVKSNPEKTDYFFTINLEHPADVYIEVFDKFGSKVHSYDKKHKRKGEHMYHFGGGDIQAGSYLVAFNVNGERKNRTFELKVVKPTVSIDASNKVNASLKVAPNPVSDKATIQVKVEEMARVKLEIFDSSGKLLKSYMDRVLSTTEVKGNLSFDWLTNGQTPGVYTVVLTVNGQQIVEQLVVQ